MSKKIKANAKILRTKWKSCSINGNPSYWVTFLNEDTGEELEGYTGTDCACGYGIKNSNINYVEYHYTATGNIIITQAGHRINK